MSVEAALRESGYASLGTLLSPEQCREMASLYESPHHFRSRIQMQRFRFGRGEYQYFAYPLPPLVETLRSQLYASLVPAASQWVRDLKLGDGFPAEHSEFLKQCVDAEQGRPTPLMLRYRQGDFNCLHQDVYGSVVFPFQVIIGLSRPGVDYEGGELLLVEQQPRAQSMGRSIQLCQGEGIVITTRYRPVSGARGFYRTNIRHGVSPIRTGERFTLGLIFHDAA